MTATVAANTDALLDPSRSSAAVAEFPGVGNSQVRAPAAQAPNSADPVAPSSHDEGGTAEEVFGSRLIWQIAAWLCAAACLGIAVVASSQLPNARKGQLTGIYGCMGLFSLFTLVAGYISYRLAGQRYAVFPDRLVEWQCFKPKSYRWDQIREVYEEGTPAWMSYQVFTSVGRAFTISGDIANYKRLRNIISERVTARLLPAVLAELEAGRDVCLGPLRISQGGVVIDGQFEPWYRIGIPTFRLNPTPAKETKRISNKNHVQIGSSLVELGTIPNYHLFKTLACSFSVLAQEAGPQ